MIAEIKETKIDLESSKRIKKEINRIKKLLKNLSKQTIDINIKLIERAAFMAIALEDLEKVMGERGEEAYVSKYQNGENQWGTKISPEIQTYNSTMKNFMTVMKQLTDLLPKDVPKEKDDGFETFVMSRD
jgi:vacuolar-type H+-ATPase subunit D/Vma8